MAHRHERLPGCRRPLSIFGGVVAITLSKCPRGMFCIAAGLPKWQEGVRKAEDVHDA